MRWSAVAVAAWVWAGPALAQAPGGGAGQGDAARRSEAGDAAMVGKCLDLLRGEVREGDDLGALRDRCSALVRAGARPGTGSGAVQPGDAVRTSFQQAGSELVGRDRPVPLGHTRSGPVENTLETNPVGWFTGLGVNAEYSRVIDAFDKVSWVADANYARANASNGNITSFGFGGGLDLFVFGRRNAGFRLGGRLGLAIGNQDVLRTTTFARLSGGGEVGYRFIASNGLTAGAAFGLGGRLAGDAQNEQFASFTGGEFGPYFKVGAGFSW
jgi:hypothetical protein